MADRLRGRDLRSIGDANAVSRELARDTGLVREAVGLLSSQDAVLRARSADALEKASRVDPAMLRPHARELLDLALAADQKEVRWHLAQMLPRLDLTAADRRRAGALLRRWLVDGRRGSDGSRIVSVCALQALWDLEGGPPAARSTVRALVLRCSTEGPPSLRARARRLLREDGRGRTRGGGGR